jgi:hyperosmotically inducible protein
MAGAGSLAGAEKEVSDDALYDLVKRRLTNDAVVKGGGIEVEVARGAVTLKGAVDTPKQKERAEKLVKGVRGVRSVSNQLQVAQGVR